MNNVIPILLAQDLQLLQIGGERPRVRQAELATQLGVAVGTVNSYLRCVIARECITIRRTERKRFLCFLTPRGMAGKSRLGRRRVRTSLRTYRETRRRALDLLTRVRRAGCDSAISQGDRDLAEICRLTCFDQPMEIARASRQQVFPTSKVDGTAVALWMQEQNGFSRLPAPDLVPALFLTARLSVRVNMQA